MKPLARLPLPAAAALACLSLSAGARADAAGDAVLAKVDAAANRAKTLQLEYQIVNQEAGKPERTLAMQVKLKGEKRFTEFSAPADMKGTKVLVLSPTQMYVYLPAFGKVRRIATSTKDQGFLGLAFSQFDLASARLADAYAASVLGETATEWRLELKPKAGQQTPYAKIEVTVDKQKALPTELKYFAADGKNIKTETRSGYTCEGEVCTAGEQKMTDNVKGSSTKLVRKSVKIDAPIADDVFSQRNLGE